MHSAASKRKPNSWWLQQVRTSLALNNKKPCEHRKACTMFGTTDSNAYLQLAVFCTACELKPLVFPTLGWFWLTSLCLAVLTFIELGSSFHAHRLLLYFMASCLHYGQEGQEVKDTRSSLLLFFRKVNTSSEALLGSIPLKCQWLAVLSMTIPHWRMTRNIKVFVYPTTWVEEGMWERVENGNEPTNGVFHTKHL